MSLSKKEIIDALKTQRAKLSESSAKTYASLLTSLGKRLDIKTVAEFGRDHAKIIDAIGQMDKPQTQKTLLSALYVLTGDDQYKTVMLEKCKVVNDIYKTQKVSASRADAWVPFEQIQDKYKTLLAEYKRNPSDMNIMNLLIVGLTSGVLIPPRRSEWVYVKIKDYNKDTDNYLEKKQFVFNKYKTAKVYGRQTVELPAELKAVMTKWLKINKTDYLFYKPSTGKPLTPSDLTRWLGSIFDGTNISVDMLRSIYLSHQYKGLPAIKALEAQAEAMGHSVSTEINNYVKK